MQSIFNLFMLQLEEKSKLVVLTIIPTPSTEKGSYLPALRDLKKLNI